MTQGINKSVFVLPGITGPTGKFEIVNIFGTGPTGIPNGRFPTWSQLTGPTGSSGPTGTFKTVCDAGATGMTGRRSIIIPGYSRAGGATPLKFNPATTANATVSGDGLTITSTGAGAAGEGLTKFTLAQLQALGGKVYLEFQLIYNGSVATFGFADDSWPVDGTQGPATAHNLVYVNNNFVGVFGTGFSCSDPASRSVGVCIDVTGGANNWKFWTSRNAGNTLWNSGGTENPATGVGGWTGTADPVGHIRLYAYFAAIGQSVKVNSLNAQFTNAPPAGFVALGGG